MYFSRLYKLDISNCSPNITTIRNEFVDSCNSLSCIVFEGNAPVVTEKVFIGFGGKILVSKQSSGWCLDIPGIWNGVFVNYDDYVPPIGTWVSASNGLLACYPFNGDICDVRSKNIISFQRRLTLNRF